MRQLMDFFYPPRCQLCASYNMLNRGHLTSQLCNACAADIVINHSACKRCALPLPQPSAPVHKPAVTCAQCIQQPPDYDSCWSPFIYTQPLEWMIQQLKFNAKLDFAPLLSNLITQHLPARLETRPDVIIPMPLHSKRLKQRGFNQSHLLIKPVANTLNIPLDLNSAIRNRDTQHQTGKNARQRKQNIKGAFDYSHQKKYRHIVIFDDVVTTGSTVSELTKTFKRAGVERVDVWCLARAEKFS